MSTDRGQSAPLGVALLLGLTILGTTAVVVFGGAALTNTQDQSEVVRAEQSMTLFDSQAARVALGDSTIQTVDFGEGHGTYSTHPSAGEISIIQLNCDDGDADGDGDPNDDGDDVAGGADGAALTTDDDAYILPPTDLGSFTYQTSDQTIAYQGGGVWRKGDSDASTMVAPPEFHYSGSTLTFPVVVTRGDGGVAGHARATVTAPTDPVRVFSDSGETFPTRCNEEGAGPNEPFTNPLTDGEVIVRIQSEYYRAWGRYFETRTQGEVSYDAANEQVEVTLVSLGQIGEFPLPGDGGSVTVSGASGGHATEEFTIRLRPDDADSANFNNLQWSMYVEEGSQRLEIHLSKSGSGGCSGGSTGITADLDIYYSDDDGETYHGWHEDDAYEATCADLNGDGDDEIYLEADFVDDEDGDDDNQDLEGGDPQLRYVGQGGMNNLVYFGISGSDTVVDPVTLAGHESDSTWEPKTYDTGSTYADTESVDRLVAHYFGELPAEFELTVDDKGSNTVDESDSSGVLYTEGTGQYVTYLHISKNEIRVEL